MTGDLPFWQTYYWDLDPRLTSCEEPLVCVRTPLGENDPVVIALSGEHVPAANDAVR